MAPTTRPHHSGARLLLHVTLASALGEVAAAYSQSSTSTHRVLPIIRCSQRRSVNAVGRRHARRSAYNAAPFGPEAPTPSLSRCGTSAVELRALPVEMMADLSSHSPSHALVDSASTILSHAPTQASSTALPGPINAILSTPTFWSVAIMLSIVGLLVSWEEAVHNLRKNIPPALFPVIDSMLAEMGGLGFIGLVLSVFVTGDPNHGLGLLIGDLSERFLGEEEILLEAFEFLHTSFFEVGVGFFVITGAIVASVLKRIKELSVVSDLALDTDGDGEVSLDEMAAALNVEAVIVDADGDGVITDDEITDALRATQKRGLGEEIGMTVEKRGAEILLIRERLLAQQGLPDNFLVEEYFEQIFAHNLEEMVELSPLTWLPLIPLISLLDSVDLSRDVISASSANAALSAGCFIDTPWFFLPSVAAQAFSLVWCVFNFWKMTAIKNMLIPTLVRDGGPDGLARFLPPRFEDKKLRLLFKPSPGIIAPIERALGGKEGTNLHERLFGAAGASGPSMFRESIKFHTWLCVAQIVFIFGQIVARDAGALYGVDTGTEIGNLPGVMPELVLYSTFVALSIAQLALAPSVFLNYCTVTSVENMTKDWAIIKAKKISDEVSAMELAENA